MPPPPAELPQKALDAENGHLSQPRPLPPLPTDHRQPRRVYRFPSGAVFEHPSQGANVRVTIHRNLLGHWLDETGQRVQVIETECAPRSGMRLTDDGQWTDPPPKPKPWSPPVGVQKPKEPSEMTASELYAELQSQQFQPADLLAIGRSNKLIVPAKSEDERIRHAPYCPAAGGLGGCCCDVSRGKSRNYNERF